MASTRRSRFAPVGAILTRGARAGFALLAAGACLPTGAVVTYFNGAGGRSITLQVGSNDTVVNTVTFDVLNADVAPTPTPVTGVPGGGAPGTSPTGGILISVTANRRGIAPETVKLTANSSTPMACVSGTCFGSGVTIPFTTISWTSYDSGGGYTGGIASGAFDGSAAQPLFSGSVSGAGNDSLTLSNVLVFTYDNSTLYPSGSYSGRVTFTASVP